MTFRHFSTLFGAIALMLFSAAHVSAQTTVIVNDSFADGTRTNDGPLQADYYTSSSTSAIEVSTGSLGLVSGTSGRGIHAIFPEQTLSTAGDMLTSRLTFTTPDSISRGGDDFRFGIFDHLGRLGGDATMHLDVDQSFSTANPNAVFNGLAGVALGLDVDPPMTPETDIRFRRFDPASLTGRFISTTGSFVSGTILNADGNDSGPDIGYEWAPNTEYSVEIMSTLLPSGDIEHTGTYIDITNGVTHPAYTVVDIAPDSTTFGMLGVHVTSDAFGTSAVAGEPDNGIDFSNVYVEFKAVPEPSAAILFMVGGLALLGLRRR